MVLEMIRPKKKEKKGAKYLNFAGCCGCHKSFQEILID